MSFSRLMVAGWLPFLFFATVSAFVSTVFLRRYSHALALLLHRLHVAEQATRVKVLCDAKRERVLMEVAYLPSAVAALRCSESNE